MTDQTESEHAELLRDLDYAAVGIQRMDRLDAEIAAKAIRALEAKAEAWKRDALRYAQNSEFHHGQCVIARSDRDRLAGEVERLSREDDANTRELHDICNALPGVAFMDPPDGGSVSIAEQVRRMYAALRSQDVEVARLTSELAAARENEARWQRDVADAYGWLWCVNEEPGTPNRFPAERAAYNARKLLRELLTKEQRGIGINKAVIQRDAARRAGEGV